MKSDGQLSKKAGEEKYTVLWVDKAGFYLLPMAVRTWAHRGQTPILQVKLTRDHLSSISGITLDGHRFMQVRKVSYDTEAVIGFLRVLLRKISGKILIIWDGSPIHRNNKIKTFLKAGAAKRLHLEQLPGYAPDAHHKLTTEIARTCGAVGIEDLHIKGMFKNRKLARAMADAGLGQLLRFLETKMETVGGRAILVDRFFPSTKKCSGCGHVKKRMPLKYSTYICLKCGLHIDRDFNAAINLCREAQRLLALSA